MISPSQPEVSKLHAILGLLSNLIVRIAAIPGDSPDDDKFIRQTVKDAQDILQELSGIADFQPTMDTVHPAWRMGERGLKIYELTVLVYAAFATRVWGDHWILPKGKFDSEGSVLVIPAPSITSGTSAIGLLVRGYDIKDSQQCASRWRDRSSSIAAAFASANYPDLGNIRVVGIRDSDYLENPIATEAFLNDVLRTIKRNKPPNYTQDLYPQYLTESGGEV